MKNGNGLKAGRWCNPTFTLNMLLSPPATRAPWFGKLSTMSCISLTYFSGTSHSLLNLQIFSLAIVCLWMKIALVDIVVLLLGMHPN